MRERAFVFHVLYAVMFTTTFVRRLLKHASHDATGRLLEKVKRVMTSFRKNCSNLKRPLLRAESSVFHVPYAVTFRPTSSTRLHKGAFHVPTDRVAQNVENAISSFCANRSFPQTANSCHFATTCSFLMYRIRQRSSERPLHVCITALPRSDRPVCSNGPERDVVDLRKSIRTFPQTSNSCRFAMTCSFFMYLIPQRSCGRPLHVCISMPTRF